MPDTRSAGSAEHAPYPEMNKWQKLECWQGVRNDRFWVVMASLPLLPLQRQCVSRITAANQYRNRPLIAGMANHEALS